MLISEMELEICEDENRKKELVKEVEELKDAAETRQKKNGNLNVSYLLNCILKKRGLRN